MGNYSGTSKSVGPRRAGLLKSHSSWYRRIQTYTCRQAQARACDKSHGRNSPREREKARKCQCTVTKPDAMAARKKSRKKKNPSPSSSRMRTSAVRVYRPLLKTNSESEAADRSPSRTANVLRRLDEKRPGADAEQKDSGCNDLPSGVFPQGTLIVASYWY